MYDVLIIGAGIEGTAIARRLSRYQLSIGVLEAADDVAMGATKANSAIVHGGYAEAHSKLKGRVCYPGRVQFAQLDSELHFGFRQTGSLVITKNEKDLKGLEEIKANGELNGLPDLSILNHDQIMEVEPNIQDDVKYALYCEGAGVCSPYEMAIALMENAIHNGAELFLNTEVTGIDKQEDGLLVHTTKQDFSTKYVINAAGLGADKIDQMVNEPTFSIHPRSGEYILLAKDTGDALNTVVFQMPTKMGKGILVTSTFHGNLLMGPDAIEEDARSFSKSTHAARLYEIYQAALDTTDKIDPKKFIRSFCGLRAVASTDDFIIGPTATKGFINVAGIQSPGLTSSPAIADMVADILADQGLELVDDPNYDPYRRPIFDPDRERLDASAVLRLAALDSCPEKLICRCEQVSEGVIVDAMHRGIPVETIDGIKRRTRASMGYCQGSYCRMRIKEVMERELGHEVDPRTDTQRNGDTRVSRQEFLDYLAEHEEQVNYFMP